MLRVLPAMNQTCFATNQVVARCSNADFLLKKKKITQKLRDLLQNKFALGR